MKTKNNNIKKFLNSILLICWWVLFFWGYVNASQDLESIEINEDYEIDQGEPLEITIENAEDSDWNTFTWSDKIEFSFHELRDSGYAEKNVSFDSNGEAEDVEILSSSRTEDLKPTWGSKEWIDVYVDGSQDATFDLEVEQVLGSFDIKLEDSSYKQWEEVKFDLENFKWKAWETLLEDVLSTSEELDIDIGSESADPDDKANLSSEDPEVHVIIEGSEDVSAGNRQLEVEIESEWIKETTTVEIISVLESFDVNDETISQGEPLEVKIENAEDKAWDDFDEEASLEFVLSDIDSVWDNKEKQVDFDNGEATVQLLDGDQTENISEDSYNNISVFNDNVNSEFDLVLEQTLNELSVNNVQINQWDKLEVTISAEDTIWSNFEWEEEININLDVIDWVTDSWSEEVSFDNGKATLELLDENKTEQIEDWTYALKVDWPGVIEYFNLSVEYYLDDFSTDNVDIYQWQSVSVDIKDAVDAKQENYYGSNYLTFEMDELPGVSDITRKIDFDDDGEAKNVELLEWTVTSSIPEGSYEVEVEEFDESFDIEITQVLDDIDVQKVSDIPQGEKLEVEIQWEDKSGENFEWTVNLEFETSVLDWVQEDRQINVSFDSDGSSTEEILSSQTTEDIDSGEYVINVSKDDNVNDYFSINVSQSLEDIDIYPTETSEYINQWDEFVIKIEVFDTKWEEFQWETQFVFDADWVVWDNLFKNSVELDLDQTWKREVKLLDSQGTQNIQEDDFYEIDVIMDWNVIETVSFGFGQVLDSLNVYPKNDVIRQWEDLEIELHWQDQWWNDYTEEAEIDFELQNVKGQWIPEDKEKVINFDENWEADIVLLEYFETSNIEAWENRIIYAKTDNESTYFDIDIIEDRILDDFNVMDTSVEEGEELLINIFDADEKIEDYFTWEMELEFDLSNMQWSWLPEEVSKEVNFDNEWQAKEVLLLTEDETEWIEDGSYSIYVKGGAWSDVFNINSWDEIVENNLGIKIEWNGNEKNYWEWVSQVPEWNKIKLEANSEKYSDFIKWNILDGDIDIDKTSKEIEFYSEEQVILEAEFEVKDYNLTIQPDGDTEDRLLIKYNDLEEETLITAQEDFDKDLKAWKKVSIIPKPWTLRKLGDWNTNICDNDSKNCEFKLTDWETIIEPIFEKTEPEIKSSRIASISTWSASMLFTHNIKDRTTRADIEIVDSDLDKQAVDINKNYWIIFLEDLEEENEYTFDFRLTHTDLYEDSDRETITFNTPVSYDDEEQEWWTFVGSVDFSPTINSPLKLENSVTIESSTQEDKLVLSGGIEISEEAEWNNIISSPIEIKDPEYDPNIELENTAWNVEKMVEVWATDGTDLQISNDSAVTHFEVSLDLESFDEDNKYWVYASEDGSDWEKVTECEYEWSICKFDTNKLSYFSIQTYELNIEIEWEGEVWYELGEDEGVIQDSNKFDHDIFTLPANLEADSWDEYDFYWWEVEGDIDIDKNSKEVDFQMPPENVDIKAVFKEEEDDDVTVESDVDQLMHGAADEIEIYDIQHLDSIETSENLEEINWVNVRINVPNFEDLETQSSVSSHIDTVLEHIEERKISWPDLDELIENYNDFLSAKKIVEDKEYKESVSNFMSYNWNQIKNIISSYPVVETSSHLDDDEFERALAFLKRYNVTDFKNTEKFRPYFGLTREEAAAFFSRFWESVMDIEKTQKECNFNDIHSAAPNLVSEIEEVCKMWLMWVDINRFRPNDYLSRAEFFTIMVRSVSWQSMENKSDPWWENYFEAAQQLWLTKESDVMAQSRQIRRYEAALIMYRMWKDKDQLSQEEIAGMM